MKYFLALLLFVPISSPIFAAQKPSKTSSKNVEISSESPTSHDKRIRAYMIYLRGYQLQSQNDYSGAINAYKEAIELAPKAASPHIALAELYFQNGNLKDAQAEVSNALNLEKDNADAHRLMGTILSSQAFSSTVDKAKANEAIIHFLEVSRLDTSDPEIYRILGRLYLATNDTDKALDCYQKFLGTGIAGPQEYDITSRIYFEKGKYRESAQAARHAYLLSNKNPQLASYLSQTLLRYGQTTEALEVYQDALKNNNNNPALSLGYAEALMRAGNYQEATNEVQKILNNELTNLQAVSILAQIQRRSGKRDQAVITLQKALKGQDITESLQLQFELAETLIELNKIDEGIKAYQDALNTLLNPDGTVSEKNQKNVGIILRRITNTYYLNKQKDKVLDMLSYMRKVLGEKNTLPTSLEIDLLREDNKFDEALLAVRQAQKQFPQERQFKYIESQLLGKLGKADEALKALKALLNDSNEDAEVYWIMAITLLENKQPIEAEQYINHALQHDEKNVDYLVTLSSIQDRRQLYKEAESTLRKAISIDPDNPTILNNLGYSLAEKNENLEESLSLVQRAVNIDPTNSSFLDSLGWVYYKLDKLDLAISYIQQAIGYDNRNATLYDHLGDVFRKFKKVDLARENFKKAIEFSKDPEELSRIKIKLQELK